MKVDVVDGDGLEEKLLPAKQTNGGDVLSDKISLKSYLGLFSMACGTFALGVNEFITPGFLPRIADSFSISVPTAAWATNTFMLTASVSSPLVALFTNNWQRKYFLTGLMSLLTISAATAALSPSFAIFLIGRALSAIAHASYMGAGAVVAGSLVPESKQGSAVALFFTGMTLSNIMGIPLETYFGQETEWRYTFWPIAGFAGLAALGISSLLPGKSKVALPDLTKQLGIFRKPSLWCAFLAAAFGYSGMLSSHTYFAKMMTDLAGFEKNDIAWLTAVYGVGTFIGNLLGGKAADKNLLRAVKGLLLSLASVLLTFTFVTDYKPAAVIMLFANGLTGFSLIAPLMGYVIGKAPEGAPLAAASNITAFGVGIALGIYLAGLAIDNGLGYTAANWVGAAMTMVGFGFVLLGETCFPTQVPASVPAERRLSSDFFKPSSDGATEYQADADISLPVVNAKNIR